MVQQAFSGIAVGNRRRIRRRQDIVGADLMVD
jgi:hypothetical protein